MTKDPESTRETWSGTMQRELDKARRLYHEGAWKEAISLLNRFPHRSFVPRNIVASMDIVEGWSWYYLGIKGARFRRRGRVEQSRRAFERASQNAVDKRNKVSVLNGLPLVLWHLGDRIQSWKYSDQATDQYQDEPSVWDIRAILLQLDRYPETSLAFFEKAYELAMEEGDHRTAAHTRKNEAGLLRETGRVEESGRLYQEALELYRKSQESAGESARFHIDDVEQELASLYTPKLLRPAAMLFRKATKHQGLKAPTRSSPL
ncbi:MAG: tetratricopeptide repeat protein [Dehalococcoidia bacterium]|nr:tetratricopeptide repeat protein [Dehalococcoidia bacterium]